MLMGSMLAINEYIVYMTLSILIGVFSTIIYKTAFISQSKQLTQNLLLILYD